VTRLRRQRPAGDDTSVTSASTARADTGEVVAAIVQEILDLVWVSSRDDFLELGGASLTAVHLAGRLQETFGVELELEWIFDHPAIPSIAAEIDGRLAAVRA
jgi:acyl carrier protein